ncbi:MAG: hypothetical protein AB7D37_07015 [Desulfovibrio sp.]
MKILGLSLNDWAQIATIISPIIAFPSLIIAYLAWKHPRQTTDTAPREAKRRSIGKIFLGLACFSALVFLFTRIPSCNKPQLVPTPDAATPKSELKTHPTPFPVLTPPPIVQPSPSLTESVPQTGARFVKTSCNSIRDTKYGNEWVIGPDVNMTAAQARQWVSSLKQCGQNWQMPTLQQIDTLHEPDKAAGRGTFIGGKYWPAKIDPAFDAIGHGSWVWIIERSKPGKTLSFNLNQWTVTTQQRGGDDYTTRGFAVRKY